MQSCPNFTQATKALADLNFELSENKLDSLQSIYNASDMFKELVTQWDTCSAFSQKTLQDPNYAKIRHGLRVFAELNTFVLL